MPTAFGGHGKGVKMTSANFSRTKADVVLTRGCINSILLVILPDLYENRVILHPRVRVERNVTIEAENFSGANIHFQIFSFDFTSLLDFEHYHEHSLLSVSTERWCARARARPFSQVQKNPWELFLSCAVRCVNQERPKVIFRHDDRISCISPPIVFPLVLLFISRRKFSPLLSLLFSGHSLSLNSSTDTENTTSKLRARE